ISPALTSADLTTRMVDGSLLVGALEWQPSWLDHSDRFPVDSVIGAETRRPEEVVEGDPFLGLLGLNQYTCRGQRDALRAVCCASPGDTIAICLPTGSGKSLCAFLPAAQTRSGENVERGVSVIVVPTVSLALDLAKRMEGRIGHSIAYRPDKLR